MGKGCHWVPRLHLAYALSRGLLPVVMVKEYAWCPTIPWIIANKLVEPPPTPSMLKGLREHRSRDVLERVAKMMGYKCPEIEKHVVDRRRRVYGVVDILAPREQELVEVKIRATRLGRHQLAQLKVYALLAWSNGYRVKRAHIATLEGALETLEVDQRTLLEAEDLVEKTWKAVESPDPPPVCQPVEKCGYCRYARLCPNRVC